MQRLSLLLLSWAMPYFLYAQDCPNLVVNGNFDQVTGGFTSDYFAGSSLSPGSYVITNNADNYSAFLIPAQDHSLGDTTKYMVIDGDMDKSKSFWKSTVQVQVGKTYVFQVYAINLSKISDPNAAAAPS